MTTITKPTNLLIFLCNILITSNPVSAINKFEDINLYVLNNSHKLNLSGLDVCGGKLLTVSDRVDNYIYEIILTENNPHITPFKKVSASAYSPTGYSLFHKLLYSIESIIYGDYNDWEGISCYKNNIYLISERKNSIYLINTANNKEKWIPTDFYLYGKDSGYFNSYNASIEGISVINKHEMFLMIERNPRGIAHLNQSDSGLWNVEFNPLKNLGLNYINDSYDVAGVAVYDEYMYTLERNAYAVCKRKLYNTNEGNCLSYEHIALDKNNSYTDEEYGLGEGIAIDEKYIYIIFDNNNSHKYKDSTDYRAILLRIPFPMSWR